MAFTTVSFIFFFLPLSIILYFISSLTKKDWIKNSVLVLVSLIFYMSAGIKISFLILGFITIVYLMGYSLEKFRNFFNKKIVLYLTFVVLVLGYFKFASIIFKMFSQINIISLTFSNIVVPVGISFIVFESISYLVDIYQEKAKAGNYLDVLLFFLFFPKVVSGPIVLWQDFYPQIHKRKVSIDQFYQGIERIMMGFAKKSIIADPVGVVVVNIISNSKNGIDVLSAVGGILCYFVQIYYDFSGYSDIAIGVSKLFGFEFKENFNFPYTATSLTQFWRKWHISLGTWFRNYIYIPLGGNRRHVYLNLFIVFMLTGIWHGSTWNFILWGLLHAIVILFERLVKDKKWYINIPNWIKWVGLMIFIMFTWTIFMIPSMSQIKIYLLSLVGKPAGSVYLTYQYYFNTKVLLTLVIGLVGAWLGNHKLLNTIKEYSTVNPIGTIIRFSVLLLVFVVAIIFMINSTYSPFLYFQF